MNALEQQFLVFAEAFDTQNKAVAQGFSHQNKEIGKLHGQLWDVATGMEKLNEHPAHSAASGRSNNVFLNSRRAEEREQG